MANVVARGVDDAPPPLIHSARRSSNAIVAHVWLSSADKRRLRTLSDKIAEIASQRASVSVLLRAGIAALEDDLRQVAFERQKNPEGRGKRENALLYAVADAARSCGLEEAGQDD
jgi:hypothetical protein